LIEVVSHVAVFISLGNIRGCIQQLSKV
jgi:hypothetical protein